MKVTVFLKGAWPSAETVNDVTNYGYEGPGGERFYVQTATAKHVYDKDEITRYTITDIEE